ncbi:AbiH family protein [Myroides odoratimimus]|uniref:AbiH family protein n=1 Tax=Myroides odoratimimus TaxID=76832 RepID=UPI0025765FDE|nr:AbiH family protein [Myroides odoratimimus]MDM1529832.1 bacteriophage abortive infection AbiH family protein [Myroides odoratimimus]
MNVLHILGNGFDLNLGLRTSYRDFYKYYSDTENNELVIKKLKEDINLDADNWSDLEVKLGEYSAELNKIEFEKVYEDLVDKLCDYLEKEMESFINSNYDHSKMFSYLAFPENYLEVKDKFDITEFVTKEKDIEVTINVLTLNYTRTLEKILIGYNKYRYYNVTRDRIAYVLGEIKHIHGYTDNRVVLGVNDLDQIVNKEFRDDEEVRGMFVKHESNYNQRHGIDNECYSLIENADIFYIYGSSLGKTDKYIWELVGKRVEKGAKVVIFIRGNGVSFRLGYKITKLREETISNFNKLAGISNEYKNSIYVGIKTDMFRFD